MSTHISSYVEKFDKESNKWILISDKEFCSNFKYFLNSNDYSDFYDFRNIDVKDFSDDLKKTVERDYIVETAEELNVSSIKCITLAEMKSYANKIINQYYAKTEILFKALGYTGSYRKSDDEEDYEEDKWNENGEISERYNPLTAQIGKGSLSDWNNIEMKANNMFCLLGICEAVENQCYEHDRYFTDDNIRFILIMDN